MSNVFLSGGDNTELDPYDENQLSSDDNMDSGLKITAGISIRAPGTGRRNRGIGGTDMGGSVSLIVQPGDVSEKPKTRTVYRSSSYGFSTRPGGFDEGSDVLGFISISSVRKEDDVSSDVSEEEDNVSAEANEEEDNVSAEASEEEDNVSAEASEEEDNVSAEANEEEDDDDVSREASYSSSDRSVSRYPHYVDTEDDDSSDGSTEDGNSYDGQFHCNICNRRWRSTRVVTWPGTKKVKYRQKCYDCGNRVFPYRLD